MTILLWTLSCCLLLGGAPPQGVDRMGQMEEAREWRGQYGGEATATARSITDEHQWTRLWRQLDKPMPALDFTRNLAVVAYAGQRPTGGFTLEFLEPVHQGEDLLIRWRVRRPAPDAFVTQAFAQPWKVKVFPQPKGKLRLEEIKE